MQSITTCLTLRTVHTVLVLTLPVATARVDDIGAHGGFHAGLLDSGAGVGWKCDLPGPLDPAASVLLQARGGDPSAGSVWVAGTVGSPMCLGAAARIGAWRWGAAPSGIMFGAPRREDALAFVGLAVRFR